MMRFLGVLFASVLVAAGCTMDPLVYRVASDYMPVNTVGNTWAYELSGGGEKSVLVAGSDVLLGRECVRVQVNFEDHYWYRDDDQFDVYVNTVYLFNEEFVLEERWGRRLVLPLILGNTWTEEFENTVDVYGESVKRTVTTKGEVIAIRDVSVPAGRFEQCYVVRSETVGETETPYGNGRVDSSFVEEYYAPEIGLIKRVNLLTLEQEVLKSYSIR